VERALKQHVILFDGTDLETWILATEALYGAITPILEGTMAYDG